MDARVIDIQQFMTSSYNMESDIVHRHVYVTSLDNLCTFTHLHIYTFAHRHIDHTT